MVCSHVMYSLVWYTVYSGLFSLSANFPEFHEWADNSGKFIDAV